MLNKNFNSVLTSPDTISSQVLWKGAGYSDDDISRPIIGIANSFSDMVPGHTVFRELAEQVKYGVYRAGGTPAEFGVIACCDALADAHEGSRYVLPSRDNIADSVEIMAKAHRLDGLVLLGSCDKIVPGMLMAAARLDIPCILVPGGCMLSGPKFLSQPKTDSTTVSEAMGKYQAGEIGAFRSNASRRTLHADLRFLPVYGHGEQYVLLFGGTRHDNDGRCAHTRTV